MGLFTLRNQPWGEGFPNDYAISVCWCNFDTIAICVTLIAEGEGLKLPIT